MDIWFTLGSVTTYAVLIGLVIWGGYSIIKKIRNKLTKKN